MLGLSLKIFFFATTLAAILLVGQKKDIPDKQRLRKIKFSDKTSLNMYPSRIKY
jgi:hypothetical protein